VRESQIAVTSMIRDGDNVHLISMAKGAEPRALPGPVAGSEPRAMLSGGLVCLVAKGPVRVVAEGRMG
jgi:hypothetical protein